MINALKIAIKDVTDKVMGLAKAVVGMATGHSELREEGQAQLDQAHVEPEAAAVAEEERSSDPEAGRIRRIRQV